MVCNWGIHVTSFGNSYNNVIIPINLTDNPSPNMIMYSVLMASENETTVSIKLMSQLHR